MKFLHKFIVVTLIVSVVVLLICYDIHKTRTTDIENFTQFQTTIITDFSPKDGDGSTVVTMTGRGLQHIQEVLFNDRIDSYNLFNNLLDIKVIIN